MYQELIKSGIMANMNGKIDISQRTTPPEKHELNTARYFAAMGKDIIFLEPSGIPKVHTPDILMDGVEWEIKSPDGKSRRTIENNIRDAVKQSHYIIFDLRRIQVPEKTCISQLEKEWKVRPYLKRLYVICKNGKLIKYPAAP